MDYYYYYYYIQPIRKSIISAVVIQLKILTDTVIKVMHT